MKTFCPHCGSKDIIFRGKYLSVRSKNRADKESRREYIENLKENHAPLYEALIEDNGGKYPSASQLDDWYSKQRKKCNSCGRSFIYDNSSQRNSDRHYERAHSRLLAIMQKYFISRHDFLELYGDKDEPAFDSVFSFQNHLDKKALLAVYDEFISRIVSFGNIPYGGRWAEGFQDYYAFVFSAKSQRQKKRIKVILFVDRSNFKIPKFVFYNEPEDFRSFYGQDRIKATVNLPSYFLKKVGLNLKSNPDKELEQKIVKILKEKGFHRAIKYGSTNEENRKIISYFLHQFNRFYT